MIVTVHQRHECIDDLSHEGPSTPNGLEVQRVKFFCLVSFPMNISRIIYGISSKNRPTYLSQKEQLG